MFDPILCHIGNGEGVLFLSRLRAVRVWSQPVSVSAESDHGYGAKPWGEAVYGGALTSKETDPPPLFLIIGGRSVFF